MTHAAAHAAFAARIRAHGPQTMASYLAFALHDPVHGYYARASRRSGGTGDFYTSADVGPGFGLLIARLWSECARGLTGNHAAPAPGAPLDLVEAGASDGRLIRAVLDALREMDPPLYDATRVHLVERSAVARARHRDTLGPHGDRRAASSDTLPRGIRGVLFANELLDAFPVHVVEGGDAGLQEIYVDLDAADDRFVERAGPPSTPRLHEYLAALEVRLAPGQRAEINLEAIDWVAAAASSLEAGYLLLFDYGEEAEALYSARRPLGSLRAYHRHLVSESGVTTSWLQHPGEVDLTAHLDWTSIRRAAAEAGLIEVAFCDQARLLREVAAPLLERPAGLDDPAVRLALKGLLVPQGIGSTHQAVLFGRMAPLPPFARRLEDARHGPRNSI